MRTELLLFALSENVCYFSCINIMVQQKCDLRRGFVGAVFRAIDRGRLIFVSRVADNNTAQYEPSTRQRNIKAEQSGLGVSSSALQVQASLVSARTTHLGRVGKIL